MELNAIPCPILAFAVRERFAVGIAIKIGAVPFVTDARAVRVWLIRLVAVELRTIPNALLASTIRKGFGCLIARRIRAIPVRPDAFTGCIGFGRLIASQTFVRLDTLPVAFDKALKGAYTLARFARLITTATLVILPARAIFAALLNRSAILRAAKRAGIALRIDAPNPRIVDLIRIGTVT